MRRKIRFLFCLCHDFAGKGHPWASQRHQKSQKELPNELPKTIKNERIRETRDLAFERPYGGLAILAPFGKPGNEKITSKTTQRRVVSEGRSTNGRPWASIATQTIRLFCFCNHSASRSAREDPRDNNNRQNIPQKTPRKHEQIDKTENHATLILDDPMVVWLYLHPSASPGQRQINKKVTKPHNERQ